MVNREGKGVRCASTGYGAGGTLAATASHSSCVSDYGKLGYIKLPDAALGVYADFNGPLITKEVREPAKSAGIKVGDEVISVDGKPIASMLDSFKALNTKSVGDKVKVVVKRDNHELTFEPVSVARGEQ
jgi:S1-C subfamily serine protease